MTKTHLDDELAHADHKRREMVTEIERLRSALYLVRDAALNVEEDPAVRLDAILVLVNQTLGV